MGKKMRPAHVVSQFPVWESGKNRSVEGNGAVCHGSSARNIICGCVTNLPNDLGNVICFLYMLNSFFSKNFLPIWSVIMKTKQNILRSN